MVNPNDGLLNFDSSQPDDTNHLLQTTSIDDLSENRIGGEEINLFNGNETGSWHFGEKDLEHLNALNEHPVILRSDQQTSSDYSDSNNHSINLDNNGYIQSSDSHNYGYIQQETNNPYEILSFGDVNQPYGIYREDIQYNQINSINVENSPYILPEEPYNQVNSYGDNGYPSNIENNGYIYPEDSDHHLSVFHSASHTIYHKHYLVPAPSPDWPSNEYRDSQPESYGTSGSSDNDDGAFADPGSPNSSSDSGGDGNCD